MATSFTITAKGSPDRFQDNVSMGDADTYRFDFTPWQEANHTISSITWAVESGSASISGKALASGVASALITFANAGRSLISILATTATEKKKVWLEVKAEDQNICVDDYELIA